MKRTLVRAARALLAVALWAAPAVAAPDAGGTRLGALVSDARRSKAELSPLFDQLADLREAYGRRPEADLLARCGDTRRRIDLLMARLERDMSEIAAELRREAPPRLTGMAAPAGGARRWDNKALLAFADSMRDSREFESFEEARRLVSDLDGNLRDARTALEVQDERWRIILAAERERRFHAHVEWGLAAILLAALGAAAWSLRPARGQSSRRRPPSGPSRLA